MKKFLPYILILIILCSFLGSEAKAQTPSGACRWKVDQTIGGDTPHKKDDLVNPPINKSNCDSNLTNYYWDPTATSPASPTPTPPAKVDPNYYLLAPLPCAEDMPGCESGQISEFDPTNTSNLSRYLNIMIRIFIGMCAILAVIMIVIGGIEYMTSELISSKEAGKEKIQGALLGLLISLGAYALLFTINPKLLDSGISLPDATVEINIVEFKIAGSGARSFDGKDIKVDFNTQGYPAAKAASLSTGVDEALILAIFAQETGSGSNTGRCTPEDPKAKMTAADKAALRTIRGSAYATTPVACAASDGYGGAIGLTQFLPTTWLQFAPEATRILGRAPDPWNTNDALLMTALYLKPYASNPSNAACIYAGGPRGCPSSGVYANYGSKTVARMIAIRAQIDQAKKDGKIN